MVVRHSNHARSPQSPLSPLIPCRHHPIRCVRARVLSLSPNQKKKSASKLDEPMRAQLRFMGRSVSRFRDIAGAAAEEARPLRPWEAALAALPLKLWRYPTYFAAGLIVTFAAEPFIENRVFQ